MPMPPRAATFVPGSSDFTTAGSLRSRRAGRLRSYGDAITQKDDYRRDLRHYTRWHVPPLTHAVRTTGTSGTPLRFQADTFARRLAHV
jgi:hypothetical protein